MSAKRGCWTCKERKVSCDRKHPACARCKKSNKICKGYGIRLSWPKGNNGRAIVLTATTTSPYPDEATQFVNATFWDMEMYRHLSTLSGMHERNSLVDHPVLRKTPRWVPFQVDTEHETLLDYFNCVASRSLGIFDPDVEVFRNVILRLAFSDGGPASKAVLQSLLTVSAIHRYGKSMEAEQMQLSAIRSLKNSSQRSINGESGIQQIAALMLICSSEAKMAKAHWSWYLRAANHLTKIANLAIASAGTELRSMVDWVAYQHVMCRFSLQNWRTGSDYWKLPPHERLGTPTSCNDPITRGFPGTSYKILCLLSEVIEGIQAFSNSDYHNVETPDSLRQLELRLELIQQPSPTAMDDSKNNTNTSELYRLAGLVYLERTTTNFSGWSQKIQNLLERAYAALENQDRCNHPFVLLILGMEARSDEHRQLFLKLLHQPDTVSRIATLDSVHSLLRSLWVQDDLEPNGVRDYKVKLRAVLSSSDILPFLA